MKFSRIGEVFLDRTMPSGHGAGMAIRYDIRAGAAENEWMVIDTATGEPVTVNDVPLVALEVEDADEFADLLNRIDGKRPLLLS